MKFNGILTDLIKQSLEVGATPALMGEPGIGKSSFVEALAYSMGTKAFVLPCNQLADKADLTGARLVPYSKDDGTQSYKTVFYPHQVIQECIDYAEGHQREWPILFLDEINRTTSDVTSGALTLVTLRRMGHVELPKNVRIIVAGNDKGNVTSLDEASLSRFAIFRVEPDAATLMSVLGDNVNPWVKAVLTQFPALIFQKSTPLAIVADGQDDDDNGNVTMADLYDGGEEMNQLTTPRTIHNLSNWLNKADPQQLAQYLATPVQIGDREVSLLNEAIEAYVGDTMFTTQLVATIAQDLANNSGGAQQSRVNVPKPNCYRSLKAAATAKVLEEKISDLTDNEKSGSLLYALKESEDNARLIELLAQATTKFESEHTRTLIEMVTSKQIDRQNLESFLQVDAPIVNQAKPVLSAFL
ncbi:MULTISPECIES: MoxR family ATPase [unclassified Streptomyces]|uniref:MoxR family ATPase n=1 Tax=unclassified Streptomyces TaxID=2593676 RepID=UPI002DD93E8E|nr:MoxR family ATPase [Streptomyces sp. NBC_01768]WSC32324.1 MoxR family ATPase [Streptomyces sp. NBC_01768]WSX06371.1 MoxR family ATPase [Streptomyces sp. NBC_00987]